MQQERQQRQHSRKGNAVFEQPAIHLPAPVAREPFERRHSLSSLHPGTLADPYTREKEQIVKGAMTRQGGVME